MNDSAMQQDDEQSVRVHSLHVHPVKSCAGIALGGLAQEHGAKLLRVKGLVEFSDRPEGPAAVHAVQHTLYPPRWLDRWPDADRQSRLVFIIRGGRHN